MIANPISINTKLYFLLTMADGEVHSKEEEMGDRMLQHLSMNKEKFDEQIGILEKQDSEKIFEDCIKELNTFNKNDQINCMAWMCLIANSDGFMDKDEWNLIYRIYHKNLALNLSEITMRQKELHRFIQQYRNIPDSAKETAIKPEVKSEQKQPVPQTSTTTPLSDKPRLAFPM
ncbi:MAG TPA: TerB family tellurite resistance protein [Fulvivirga sp.]|nr:TerB family tellurite resistance protein [Fulvivirga sp.]